MRNIFVRVVKSSEQPFCTIGHWMYDKEGNLLILITKMKDWRYEFGVFIHEIVEWALCEYKGITVEECDKFDELYEEGYRTGKIPVKKEAGYDKHCPYHRGHVWGDRISWVIMVLLGVNWKDYNLDADRIIDEYVFKK